MMYTRLNKQISFFFLFIVLMSACVAEDLSNCMQSASLKFRYVLNPTGEDLFGVSVDKVRVFIFNAEGKYIAEKSDSSIQFTNDYQMPIALEEGHYSFVVVCGKETNFLIGRYSSADALNQFCADLVVGKTTLDEFRIKINTVNGDFFPKEIGTLFVANQTNISIPRLMNEPILFNLTNDRNIIDLEISGLNDLKYTPVLTSRNGRYNYENNIPADAKDKIYTSSLNKGKNKFQFDVMRLLVNAPLSLRLIDERGRNVLPGFNSINLIQEILKSPDFSSQLDLDKNSNYTIKLKFEGATLVSISINSWVNIQVKPEA